MERQQIAKYPFIVFEGIDCSGKSTLAKLLVEKFNGAYFKTPPSETEYLRESFDLNPSLEARFLYYLLGCKIASDRIVLAKQKQLVICDRYYYATIASHRLLGLSEDVIAFHKTIDLVEPDLVFMFDCTNETERLSRFEVRGKSINDLRFLDQTDALRGAFRSCCPAAVTYDTAGLTIEESLRELVAIIQPTLSS